MQDALSAGQGENITRKLSKLSIKVPRGVNMTPISEQGSTQVLVNLSNSLLNFTSLSANMKVPNETLWSDVAVS